MVLHIKVWQHFLGMDGGGKFLKICCSIFSVSELQSPSKSPAKKKGKTEYLDTGVKKLLILSLAPGVPESYYNMKLILQSLQINFVSFLSAMDLKLANICAGMQGHSSTHPCIYCFAASPFLESADLRTLGDLRRLASKFDEEGRPLSRAKEFYNVVHHPLFDGPDDTFLLDIYPPPSLHILLGVVNMILEKLKRIWGDMNVKNWLKTHNIVQSPFYDGQLQGNQCRSVLKKAGDLELALPRSLGIYAISLSRFNEVVNSCYTNVLSVSYELDIKRFNDAFEKLALDKTTKVHIVTDHFVQFLKPRSIGMSVFSEQAVESAHNLFSKIWENYKVTDSHSQYESRLFRAVMKFNSMNME